MWDDWNTGGWSDMFGGGSSSSGLDSSIFGSGGDSYIDSSWWSGSSNSGDSGGFSWGNIIGGLFGGGSSNNSGSNIWGQMLAGAVGGAGQQGMNAETIKMQGDNAIRGIQESAKQSRQTANFAAELKDYYDQKGKAAKRNALDTYGQFSLTDRYAPNMAKVAPIAVPTKPQLA